jgi:hypothetical protein
MTMPASESSLFGRKPVTLYKFMLEGGQESTPVTDEEMIFEDGMDYADLIALQAAGWTLADTHTAANWNSMDTAVKFEGAASLKALTFGSSVGQLYATRILGLSDGVEPSTYYRLKARMRMTVRPWYDVDTLIRLIGDTANAKRSYTGDSNEWTQNVTGAVISSPSGQITVRLERIGGWSTVADVHWDQIQLWKQVTPVALPVSSIRRTSFRRTVVFREESYAPAEIEHSEPSQGVEDAPGTVQISLPGDDAIAIEFKSSIPPSQAMVAVYQYHRPPVDEPDPTNVRAILFDIVSAEHHPKQTVLTCASIIGQGEVIIPSGLVQREQCMFNTYDPLTCGVDPTAFTFEGVVALIDGLEVTVTGASAFNIDPNFFTLGDFSLGFKHTMIKQQEGDVMLLDEMIPDLVVGDVVKLLAGDDRQKETCRNKFFNIERYFAFPNLPVSNPYYGQGLRP